MNTSKQILQQLLNRQVWSQDDRNWLNEYLQQNDTPELRQIMLEKFSATLESGNELPSALSEGLLANIHRQIKVNESIATSIPMSNWKKFAAAAIFIIVSTIGYFLLNNNPKEFAAKVETIKTDKAPPNTNNAVITLANGEQIVLDSAGNGTLAIQGNVNVIKTADGQIVYNGTSDEVMYNTLSNPRGSKAISLTLIDGTKVWLNSESSLRYPTAFIGIERAVEITGEAYFEVTKNTYQPFIVNIAGKGNVEVLGTHFNINSYEDELSTKVTLLEGSIKLSLLSGLKKTDNKAVLMMPGQQAQYHVDNIANKEIKVKSNVDVAAVIAWKYGFFNFDNADLQTVLRQLSRWYNVEVIYKGTLPKRNFGGEMQRDLNLSEVLKLLEKNNIHFKIEDNKLIVTP